MTQDGPSISFPSQDSAWWKEKEIILLLLIVAGAHLFRTGVLNLSGEEPRWAQVASKMEHSGDWVTPREQGELFHSRPPLHPWLTALNISIFGGNNGWVLRFHSVMSILLMSVILYGYCRQYLSRTAAFAAAVGFATMGETFTIGQLGESDALFILLVSGSILIWHWGFIANWHPCLMWSAAYGFAGLAFLCKGSPQPPVYLCGTVGVFLVIMRRWRSMFTIAHGCGILIGFAIVAAWAIPYASLHGWHNVRATCLSDTSEHLKIWNTSGFLLHLIRFPLDVSGGTLPWSLLLLPYLRRDFRRWAKRAYPQTLLPAIAILVIFPTCWIPPDGRTRYVAPMYPFLSILAGVAVEAALSGAIVPKAIVRWTLFLRVVGSVMLIFVGAILVSTRWFKNTSAQHFWMPTVSATVYSGMLIVLSLIIFRTLARAIHCREQEKLP